ncbi:MAG: enoyl-CoA hydratase/isomerase family protein [Blastocatellia bacterium]|jgi:2-(1,2-epoxy-1,2-dihydrophenyl)acetyl-CoA isomerase|nr:enoyl-CoA hydratase/isomerase family protein [Blastocatellia bacterium]MBK6428317.1 enoyl-CoA hydratase/isomerase family protein [Blastocatellia bacterium]
MDYANIAVERKDGIGRLTITRPEALNALDKATGEELLDALDSLRTDSAVRVIVLTGAGRAFSAGGDIKEMSRAGELPESFFDELLSTLNCVIVAMTEMPKPVIAAVNGIAAGLGFNLALACDLRIAARGAEFTQAFLRIGLIPDGGGTFLLPRIIGWSRAMELILTARSVSSEEALRLGLVTAVVDETDFEATVEQWARQLAGAPTAAVGRVKQLLAHSVTSDLKSQLRFEREMQMASGKTDDFREGITAFLEKRTPRFTGS